MSSNSAAERSNPLQWSIEKLTFGCSETVPIEIDQYTYDTPQISEFDMHYSLELGIVTTGSMDRHYLSGSRSYGAGEAWICGMWEPHGWAVSTVPATVIVLFLYPPMLVDARFHEAGEINFLAPFTVSPDQRPTVPPGNRAEVLQLAAELATVNLQKPALRKIVLHLRTLELLTILMDAWEVQQPSKTVPASDLNRIGDAMRLVFDHRDFVTVSEVARECGMNRNALSRLFIETTGMPFAEFALRYRVSSAAAEVRDTESPMKTVAANWGFTDSSHFFR
ncbi:MAG: helix-turn-helix transcriptional regulator, partial [Spirochaetaceae bacterium]|nr:helix-turn-helix transcriptional regulator [Spirochaetaceae bacterium]